MLTTIDNQGWIYTINTSIDDRKELIYRDRIRHEMGEEQHEQMDLRLITATQWIQNKIAVLSNV